MKRLIFILFLSSFISHHTAVCNAQDDNDGIASFLADPNATTFKMTWYPGGANKRENMLVTPPCLRVYHVQTLKTPPRDGRRLIDSGAEYGRIQFCDFGRTKFVCGLRKSSQNVVGYDIFFIDLNHNGHLEKDELFKGEFHDSTMGPDVIDCHYGPIDLTLRGRDSQRTHRVFAWYHMLSPWRPGELYLTSHCYLDGRIRLSDKEIKAVLVDYNCDGRYDSGQPGYEWIETLTLGPRELDYDLIGWDTDGDGRINFTEQHFVGGCTIYENRAYRIQSSLDGRIVTVRPLQLPMGHLQMPTKSAFIRLVGDLGPINLRVTDGFIDVPAGTYWIDYLHIDEPNDDGEVTRLTKSGRYFDEPWEIRPGVTTKVDRVTCTVTDADKEKYEARIRKQRAARLKPEVWPILGEPLGKLDEFNIDFDPEKVKGKQILVCFWDMEQRPSRHCIIQLAKQAEQLKQKGVTVVAVQASKVDENALNEWVKKYKIPFPVGMIQGDVEKTRFTWGVRSLPWLILTDKEDTVRAEGFSLAEMDDKIKEINYAEE